MAMISGALLAAAAAWLAALPRPANGRTVTVTCADPLYLADLAAWAFAARPQHRPRLPRAN